MHHFATIVLVLTAFQLGNAATGYVVPESVNCANTGVYFTLSRDASKSKLYNETQLQIDLFTGSKNALVANTDFDPVTGKVNLSFTNYQFDVEITYGPDQRPLLYNIEQPFLAVPKKGFGIGHNYTFGVYCIVPASYNVNITNKTDDDHANHRVDIVVPQDHVQAGIIGLRSDNSSKLGDKLTYHISLKDDTYAALLPVDCKYYNPNSEFYQFVPFVSDSCPRIFPDDPDAYFQTMKQRDSASFEANFRAFSFESTTTSVLGIDCSILLCISSNIDLCHKPCWGGEVNATSESGTPGTFVRITETITVKNSK